MKTVYKYTLVPDDYITLRLPADAQILSIQEKDGHPQMWALVDSRAETEPRTFLMMGTGQDVDENLTLSFIGTFQLKDLGLVFHVFEVL